jgi:serine/threonine protein phosphatase PrpC
MQDSVSPSALNLTAAGATDIGRSRSHNEDSVLVRPDLNLYVVADGAGGHNAGNVASALATTSMARFFESTAKEMSAKSEMNEFGVLEGERRMAIAIQKANQDIIEISKTSNKHKGMGTTVVAMCVSPAGLMHIGYVGDSRCYRLRDGNLELMTRDHSLINDLIQTRPDMDSAVLARLPRNVVTRALGMQEVVHVDVQTRAVVPGDRYLLTSDGLSDTLKAEEILETLKRHAAPDEIVRMLIDRANEEAGDDNIAALVLFCDLQPGSMFARRPVPSVVRKRAKDPPPEPVRRPADSYPELIIVSIDDETDLEPQIHVVPDGTASDGMLDELGELVAPPRRAAVPRSGTMVTCEGCGKQYAPISARCPFCGKAREGS